MIERATKYLAIAVACALMTACGGASSPENPSGNNNPISPSQPAAAFADSNLEAAVLTALGGLTGTLTADTLLSLERLSARDRGIADLHGIEQLRHLQALDLSGNRITDLAPLAGLTRLVSVDLSSNQVQDLSPLAGLDSLQSLSLAFNPINDLAPLLRLGRLQWLEVLGVQLSPVAQESQLPTLRQHGVEIALSPASDTVELEHPDNRTRIAFYSDRDLAEGERGYRLYTVHPDGGDLRKANDLVLDGPPRFSPSQEMIAFEWDTDYFGPVSSDIYIARVDGSDLRNLTQDRSSRLAQARGGSYMAPFWSPTGDQVTFRSSGGSVLLINADGTGLRRFFSNDELDQTYLVSPSNQWDKVVFLSGEGATMGTRALYVSAFDGTNRFQIVDAVVDTKVPSYSPAWIVWSPDDQKVAFVSNRDGNRELYVVNIDGSGLTRLTHDDGYDTGCAWSPDGRWLAFNTNRETKWDVFVVDIEGKNTYNLTLAFADEYVCGWLEGE
ncbi:MAG: leucine-rich repeat domain-containing protein [Candidatus Latescibacterota bacterium]|jgi:TolB protein